jgi:hypothetical protein
LHRIPGGAWNEEACGRQTQHHWFQALPGILCLRGSASRSIRGHSRNTSAC